MSRTNDLVVLNAEKDKVNNINLERVVDVLVKYKEVRLFEINVINLFFKVLCLCVKYK